MNEYLKKQDVIDEILSEPGNDPNYPDYFARKVMEMEPAPGMEVKDVNLGRGELGALLEDMRKRCGETRRDTAELTRIGRYRLEAYERGKAFPNINTLQRLLKHYGYTIIITKEGYADGKKRKNLF